MNDYNEKSGSGIRNVKNEDAIYPSGDNEQHISKGNEIRTVTKAAKPDQAKKSDMHYVGESSRGVKKTNMSHGSEDPKENGEPNSQNDLIEPRTWDSPQPEKDKDNPL